MFKQLLLAVSLSTAFVATTAIDALACGDHEAKSEKTASCDSCSQEDHGATAQKSDAVKATKKTNAKLTTASMNVEGWHCQSCANKTLAKIQEIEGVAEAKADFDTKQVTVKFDAKKTNAAKLKEAVAGLGFKVVEPNTKAKKSS